MVEHVVVSDVAEIGLGRREERRRFIVPPLTNADPTEKTARGGVAPRITSLLPPGKTLRQQRARPIRLTAHIGHHPADRKRHSPRPGFSCIRWRLEGLVEPAPPFIETATVVPE